MKLSDLAISRNVYLALGAPILGGLVACSAGTGPEPGTPGGDTTPPGTAATTVSIQGVLRESDGSPGAGVTVCLRTDPLTAGGPCTTSDSKGAWTIATVPANANVAITFEKVAFVPTLRAISTGTGDVTVPDAEGLIAADDAVAAQTGRSPDATSGSVAFFTDAPGSPQAVAATASLRPVDGAPLAAPRYDNVLADAGAGTSGVFGSVPRGLYVLTLGDASVPCTAGSGLYGYPITLYSPPGEARMLVPVVPGFLTTPVAAVCTKAPASVSP